tara:strand:+ start:10815 stop:11795 length:981 start_codon:yes stop_codon:yes gene_type:complete
MIKKLVTNVKNRMTASFRFETPYVFIHGRNGSGKSAVIHALELACFNQVYDAAGKDIKLARHLDLMMAEGGTVRASILTNDFGKYEYRGTTAGYRNAVHEAMTAMNGGSVALYKFLLKHVDNDMPLMVVHQQWDAQVKQHGGYRQALLKMDEVVGKSLRSHRAKIKELDIAMKYMSPPSQELIAERSQAILHEAQAKDLTDQIKREMHRFYLEIAPALEEKMNRYMPDGMAHPRFVKTGKDARLGLQRRPAPSGAESVALAIALAAAVLPMDESVIIFPDRAYDAKTLGAMLRVARTIPAIGVYVQSPIKPEGYELEAMGWQVLPV